MMIDMDRVNPLIFQAVNPLRVEAMDAAEERAQEVIDWAIKKLEEGGWDLEKVAPIPESGWGRDVYMEKRRRRTLFLTLVEKAPSASYLCGRPGEPYMVQMSEKAMARFISQAAEMACDQYDMFIYKLTEKVGEGVVSVSLEGNHIWGKSILHVTKEDGAVEKWKTQTIWNVSSLGTPFNQWPTRKVK